MKTTTTHARPNLAQRLLAALHVPSVRTRRSQGARRRQIIVEPLEPRYLLSGEGLVIPPAPKPLGDAPVLEQLLAPETLGEYVIQPGLDEVKDVFGSQAERQVEEVIFVDAGVEDRQTLIDAALQRRPDQPAPASVEVVVLDGERDGVEQISAWLKQYKSLKAVHILSHGGEASLQLGNGALDAGSLERYQQDLRQWGDALAETADILIYGCDVAAGGAGKAFLAHIAEATGADVAASDDRTGAAALGGDWDLERSVGVIDARSLSAGNYASILAVTAATADINATVKTQLLAVLEKVDATATAALTNAALTSNVPGLSTGVNGFLGGLDGATFFGLQAAANTYLSGGSPTLSGLASALQTAITTKVTALQSAFGGSPVAVATVTPSIDPAASEVVAGLNIKVAFTDWTKTQASTAIAGFTAPGSLTTVGNLAIDLDVGITLSGVTSSSTNATAASSTDYGSWFRVNTFKVTAAVSGTSFAEQAGIKLQLKDPNNSDGLDRITLADFATLTGADVAAKSAKLLDIDVVAQLFATDGTYVALGKITGGALAANVIADSVLNATALRSAFSTADANLSKLDDSTYTDVGKTISNVRVTLPMADVSMLGLLTMSDGRTFSDVLSFQTPANSSVLEDYLASTASPKLSGLLDYIRQYLTGTGVYDGLEAVFSSSAVAGLMDVSLSGMALSLNLTFDRRYYARFTFGDKLAGMGIDWLPGYGVLLSEAVSYNSTWDISAGTFSVGTLTAQVGTVSPYLDADVTLGAFKATALGILDFQTSTVTFSSAGTATPSVSGTPTVSANADFDIVGSIGTTSFKSFVNRATTDATTGEVVITTVPTLAGAVLNKQGTKSAADDTVTFSGTATLASGESLYLDIDGTRTLVVSNTAGTSTAATGATYSSASSEWTYTTSSVPANTAQVTTVFVLGGTISVAPSANTAVSGTATAIPGQSLVVTVDSKAYTIVDGTGTAVSGTVSGTSYTSTYNSTTGAWSVTLTGVASVTNPVTAHWAPPAVALSTLYPPAYSSTTNTVPTVKTLKTGDTTPVISGLATLSSGQTLTIEIYSGSSETGTPLQTFTLGDGNLGYDAATHLWSATVTSPLTAGTYSVKVKVDQLPHIGMSFGTGATTLVPVDVNMSSAGTTELVVTRTDFDPLRKFINVDSATLANMLTDIGTYLEKLRDSGQFDSVLPYTNLTLGDALDFSAILNQVVDRQLIQTQNSGITATNAISPVLANDVSFDIQFARPGDVRNSLVTVTILKSETTSFKHIDQLAALIDQKLATAYGGMLAYSTGDGTVPSAAIADITESVKGGLSFGGVSKSNEIQDILLHASSGTFTLTFGGKTTGPLSVFATADQVQHALESLDTIGAGNVVVQGPPKHYSVEFIRDLGEQDLGALTVAFTNATRGGALDVLASNLVLDGGVVKGRLNILENVPDTFKTLRVAPSAGVSIQSIVTGATTGTASDQVKTAAVQRIVIAFANGGNFKLTGKKADGTAFTTGNISLELGGTWSTRIENALNLALGYSSTTGVTVAPTASTVLATMQGVQAFDITFGGTSAKGVNFDTLKALIPVADTEVTVGPDTVPDLIAVTSRAGVNAGTFVLKEASVTANTGEIQRMVFSNLSWGTGGFSFGFSADGRSYESDAIYLSNAGTPYTQAQVATAIKTALFNLMVQMDPTINDTGAVTVTSSVADSTTGTYAFDIAFSGQLAGRDIAQIIVNPVALTPKSLSSLKFSNLTLAGFSPGGQDNGRQAVTTFNTLDDLLARFQQAVNNNLASGTFSVNPRYDAATSSVLFDLKFLPTATTRSVALTIPSAVGDLSGLEADASLDLTTQALFEGTIGFDFRTLNTFALQAVGSYKGVVTAPAEANIAALSLLADSLAITIGSDTTYNASVTSGTYSIDSLVTAIQTTLNSLAVVTDGDLASRGFSYVGDAVKVSKKVSNSKNYLVFTVNASVSSVTIDDNFGSLGFSAPITVAPAPTSALPSNGQLSADATFSLIIDDSDAVAVTVAKDTSNASIADLIADINTALNNASVAANSYLTGLGFSDLGDIAQVYLGDGNKLQLVTSTPKVGSLEILIKDTVSGKKTENNTAATELGFKSGQKSRTSGTESFLQNVTLGGDWSATVHDQTTSADTTLSSPGEVTIGMLDLTFNKLAVDYQGSYRFELRQNSTQTTTTNNDVRLSLNDVLWDAVSGQVAQLGMGGPLSTKSDQSVSGVPVQSNGQLLRDVGLTVTIDGANTDGSDLVLDVTVTKAATASNTSISDLAADVDAAIQAAIAAASLTGVTISGNTTPFTAAVAGASGTTYKASNGFVGVYQYVDDKDTSDTGDDTTTYHLQFFAPTVTKTSPASPSVSTISIDERLLVGNTITPVLYAQNSGTAGTGKTAPTAGIRFGGLGVEAPSSLTAQAVVTSGPTVDVAVTNFVAMLGGAEATTTATVVPSDGLGSLTPLTRLSWAALAPQFAALSELFGGLDGFGTYGELGRLLPLLGTSVSDVLGLQDRLDAIQDTLAEMDGSVVGTISAAASGAQLAATGVTAAAAFSLSFDNETAYDFTLASGTASRDALVSALQTLLDTKDVQSDSALKKLGLTKVGQAVVASLDRTTGQVKFTVRAGVQSMTLSAGDTSKFVTELGFLPSATVVPVANTVGLASLQSVLASAFGASSVSLSYDSTGKALRFKVPYSVQVSDNVGLNLLLNDEFTQLLSADDRAKLTELAGSVTSITDGDANAPLRLQASVTLNLDFGLDLDVGTDSTLPETFGKIFLYDHMSVGATGLTDDTGTFATVSLTAAATAMSFDTNIGLMTLRIADGAASLTTSASLLMDKDSDSQEDRVYLNTYDTLHDAAVALGATRGDILNLADFRKNEFDVFFTGNASAELPMTLVLSDDLGQLALQNLTNFTNPMPIGTMEVDFVDFQNAYRAATDQTLHIDVATSAYAANVMSFQYGSTTTSLTIAATSATGTSDIVSDAQIKASIAEKVAVLIKGAKTGWGTADYASMVGVTGTRPTGFDITLTGSLATDYLAGTDTLSIGVNEGTASGMTRGTFATPKAMATVAGIMIPAQDSTGFTVKYGAGSVSASVSVLATVTDAVVQGKIKTAVATQLGVSASSTEIVVSGDRSSGYTVTLSGTVLAAKTAQITVAVTSGTSTKSYVRSVFSDGVPISNGVVPAQTIELSTTASGASTISLNLARSDVFDGLGVNATAQRALADATLKLITSASANSGFTSAMTGVKVSSTGETMFLSYQDSKQSITFGAATVSDVSSIQNAVSTLLTGSTASAALVTVAGDRANLGFTITLTGALAKEYAGELRIKTADGIKIRQQLVTVTGDRVNGFDVVLSSPIASLLGSSTLTATVKETTTAATPTLSASGSVSVNGVSISDHAQTIAFSYAGKTTQRLGIAASNGGYGIDSLAEIKSAMAATVSNLLTGSAASASLVTVGGTSRATLSITLTGALASGYAGTLTVAAYDVTTTSTVQRAYTRGTPSVIAAQVLEAAQPAVLGSSAAGTDDSVAEGAPADVDKEANLNPIDVDPYYSSALGADATTSASAVSAPTLSGPSGSAPSVQPSASGKAISYILPNFGHWQDTMLEVIQQAGGVNCDPDQLSYFPIIFLLRDPTVLTDSLDSIFGAMQTGLEGVVTGLGKLPLIGDQLIELTQAGSALDFVIDMRKNVLGGIRTALEEAMDVYGGLDNALRMMLFDVLTTDMNGDWSIDEDDESASGFNKYLNFVRDYNGDGVSTPDDIVVEYLVGVNQDMSKLQVPAGMTINAFDAGQRAFWVTSGKNTQIGAMTTPVTSGTTTSATLTVQPVSYGGYSLGFTMGTGDEAQIFQTGEIDPSASDLDIQSALQTVLDAAKLAYEQANGTTTAVAGTVTVTAGTGGTFSISISGGVCPGTFSVTESCYTSDAGELVLDASMEYIVNQAQSAAGQTKIATLASNISAPGTANLTVRQDAAWGEFRIGFVRTVDGKPQTVETIGIARNASAFAIQSALQDALDAANEAFADTYTPGTVFANSVAVTGGASGAFTITLSGASGAVLAGTMQVTQTDTKEFNRQEFLRSVLESTSSVQFRMNLGLTYSADVDIGFDIGVDGLPLYLTTTGGLAVDINWETYLGFGVDVKDGFFLNVNMPNHAGIGSVTMLDDNGVATGVEDNSEDDHVFSYMFAVGKMDYTLGQLQMLDAVLEQPDEVNYYKYLRTDELVISVDFYFKGEDRDRDGEEDAPFSMEGQLLFLNAQIHDDWSGYVQDNTGAYWGDISKSAESLWVKAERVSTSSSAYTSASVKTADGTTGYGFILPDDSYTNSSGHTVDDALYDLDYKELNTDNGGNLFYIDSEGYLRYARNYTIGNSASVDRQDFYTGDHVQQRKPNGRPLDNDMTTLGSRLFKDNTGITGSRSHLYLEFAIDIHDPGAAGKKIDFNQTQSGGYSQKNMSTSGGPSIDASAGLVDTTVENGRLTFAKLAGQSLGDLFEAKAEVRAQLNLVVELGIGLDGSGKLPSIHGGFHLLWGKEKASSTSEDKTSKFASFNPQYDKLFTDDKPSIWLTDISLDLGVWASNFLVPVAKKIQEVIAPVQPVIDLVTAPIPGISDIMGREYSLIDLASDLSKTFGGDARIDFIIAMVRIATVITKIPTDAKNLIIPVTDVLILSGEASRQYNLAPVKGVLSNIDAAASSAGIPGQTTVSLTQGMQDFGKALKKPGSEYITFPILTDPFTTTINLLLGNPADIFLFTPPDLQVEVGFRLSFPVFPPLYVGLGGEIKLQANLTIGYDTYGITQSLATGNWLNVFNGFYVSDNVVNGTDVPEVILTTKIYAFAELNGGIIRGGVEGGIKFIGTLDLCDPNKDGKVRAFEIIAAIQENPLDLVSAELKATAYISAYLDIFALVKYVRVFEYTFMDITMFSWEFNPCDKQPVLATMDGSTLVLNTGSTLPSIDGNPAINYQAKDRLRRDVTDGNETYILTGSGSSGATIHIKATLPNGQTYEQDYQGINAIHGYGGNGNDTFDASGVAVPVYLVAGSGTDTMIGGSGNDILMGSASGAAILRGNGGNDKLIARGGTTTMAGGTGDDIYRFLGAWGQATLIDGTATDDAGENTLDFSAQTASVRLDDANCNAMQGSNKVLWATTTLIDLVKGGSASDYLDFSGREANLTASITGTNAGWVTNAATGDGTVSNFSVSSIQTTSAADTSKSFIGSHGFKFIDIENLIGGQGSDVFYVRNGASVTGSLYGDTSVGLYHDATTGNENANARNTIDFSDYTTAVVANQEGSSAFGTAGAKNIVVRGMHNLFGGAAGDTLIGEGHNNLIAGNGGADLLEGRAMHDLLIADQFLTWTNEASSASTTVVKDYVSLEKVGIAGGFGSDGRRWVWLGQTLKNKSLTGDGQTLKGGSGNDIIMGALGGDTINIGGAGEGNDTIMADLGQIMVDYTYRSPLRAYTIGANGGNDRIYLGSGNNVVLAGAGNDSVSAIDTASSMNIVVADVGDVKFRYSLQTVTGASTPKNTFTPSASLATVKNHLLDYVTTVPVASGDAWIGGSDTVDMTSGSGIVLGGKGNDAISFSALAATAANVRWISGDHATLTTDVNGSIIQFKTDDTASATGGMDAISVGTDQDTSARYLGDNYILGGMGTDRILISASYDETTATLTQGLAFSRDVIVSDNGTISRPALSQYLSSVESTRISSGLGGVDLVATANGDKIIVGGQGADVITIKTGSDSLRYIAGDNATLTFDLYGGLTDFYSTDTQDETGGADKITLVYHAESDANADRVLGENFILGGMGADEILVTGSIDPVSGKVSAGTALSEDILLGDNGEIRRLAKASADGVNRMLKVASTVPEKGGIDIIATGDGGKVILGGYGGDILVGRHGDHLVAGDNAQFDYDASAQNGILRQVENTTTVIGGNDSITLEEGFKLVLGGYGSDAIDIIATGLGVAGSLVNTGTYDSRTGGRRVTGIDAVADLSAGDVLRKGRSGRYVVGDNARVSFDDKGGLTTLLSTDAIDSTGGVDSITLGKADTPAVLGYQVVVGGMGADTITVRATSTSQDVIFGDNVDYRRKALDYQHLSFTSLLADKGGDDRIVSGRGDKTVVGGFGADTVSLNTTIGAETPVASDNVNHPTPFNRSLVLGDSGVVSFDLSGSGRLKSVETQGPGFGGVDSVTVGDGDVTFLGGYAGDTLSVNSTQKAFRVAVGDNASLTYGSFTGQADLADPASLTRIVTLDTTSTTGGGDSLRFGPVGGVSADMGIALMVGGMASDTLTLTGATADHAMLVGDNADVIRTAGRLGQVLSFQTLLPDQGAGDTLQSVSGTHLLAGGQGADSLRAGSGAGVVFGDGGSATFAADGALQYAVSVGTAQGGNDTIELGSSGATSDGDKVVIGGYGADSISVTSLQGSGSVPRERVIAGDNASLSFDAGRLVAFATQDPDASTGGNDSITLSIVGTPADSTIRDNNVLAGGVGMDTVQVFAAVRSHDVISGDNLDYRRTGSSGLNGNAAYQDLYAEVLQGGTGGDDIIRTGSGYKLVFGGAGADRIDTQTINGGEDYTDTNIVFGDAGAVTFDPNGSGLRLQIASTSTSAGGNDTVGIGPGRDFLIGGLGNDNLTISSSDSLTRYAIGDNGQIDFDILSGGLNPAVMVQTTGNASADPALTADTLAMPSSGLTIALGGTGFDGYSGASANVVKVPETGSVQKPEDAVNRVVSYVTLGDNGDLGEARYPGYGVKDPSGGSGGGGSTGTLTGSGAVGEDATLTASGRLAYPALSGVGYANFQGATVNGQFGAFVLATDGAWTYTLDNSAASVQALKTGETRTETFLASTDDGSTTTVSITVEGKDDVAVITGTTTGTLTEDASSRLTASNTLVASDPDAGQSAFRTSVISTGNLGVLTINAAGTWAYSVDNSLLQYLGAGQTRDETYTVTSLDGSKTQAITITLHGVNDTPGGAVTVSGTTTQGQTLTAGNTLTDAEGLGTVAYQWQVSSDNTTWTNLSTGDSVTLTEAQVGETLRVVASYTDASGTLESVTSTATASSVANVNDAPTGTLAISGTPTKGQTLTAASTLTDADGTGTITYTWKADGNTVGTGESFTLNGTEVGKVITVTASYTDGHGTTESVTSAATAAVADTLGNSTLTISGTPTQSQTLTATVSDPENISGSVGYQWYADGVAITGAIGTSLTLTEAQVGKVITVAVTYKDGAGNAETKTSASTSPVANVDDPGSVTVSGTPSQGETLTATVSDPDGIVAGSLGYQWYADGVAITGATGATFTLTQDQVGKVVTVSAGYTDAKSGARGAGSPGTGSVGNVNDPGEATIAGTPLMGQTLSVTVSDPDGIPGAVSYQWYADGVAISGATGDALVLSAGLVGKAISVSATYTDAFGASESVRPPAPTALVQPSSAFAAAAEPTAPVGSLSDGSGLVGTTETGSPSPSPTVGGASPGGTGAFGPAGTSFGSVQAERDPSGTVSVGAETSPDLGAGAVLGRTAEPSQGLPEVTQGTLGGRVFTSASLVPTKNPGLPPLGSVDIANINELLAVRIDPLTSAPIVDMRGIPPGQVGRPQVGGSGGGTVGAPEAPAQVPAGTGNAPAVGGPAADPSSAPAASESAPPPAETPSPAPSGPAQAQPEPRAEVADDTEVQMADGVVSLAAFAGVLGSGQGRIDWSRLAQERNVARRRAA